MEEFIYSMATRQDIPEILKLWDVCFHDDDSWTSWYFGKPFDGVKYMIVRSGGKIVSMAHIRDYTVKIRNKLLPAVSYCGFATHPDFRGKRLLTTLILRLSDIARDDGAAIGFHSPNKITRHYPVLHFESADVLKVPLEGKITGGWNIEEYYDGMFVRLLDCYNAFANRYSGMVIRDKQKMSMRLNDFMSDGGKIICVVKGVKITGYAIYYNHYEGEKILAEEIVYDDKETLIELLDELSYRSRGRGGVAVLPKDAEPYLEKRSYSKAGFAVMNAINVGKTLRTLGVKSPFAIKVTDSALGWNNGVYTTLGGAAGRAPDFEINAGRLMQLLNGYKSVNELLEGGFAKENTPGCAKELGRLFPKQNCYVFEKY